MKYFNNFIISQIIDTSKIRYQYSLFLTLFIILTSLFPNKSIGQCTPSAPATFTNSTPVAIPTGPGVATSTIVIAGGPTYIYDLNVLTSIQHTFNADLDITITSPGGTIVTLTTDNGAGNDNIFDGTLWDDDANPSGQVPYTANNGMVGDHTYVNLTLATPLTPEEPLAAFIGENANGTWTITISDDLAGDGGSLNSWSLITRGLDAPPTVTTTNFSNNTPVAIPTGPGVVTSTLVVSGAGTLLHDVNLTTFIQHTFNADLDITLTSPAGTIVTITSDNGAGNDNIFDGTVWDDDANPLGQVPYTNNNGMVSDHVYANLTLASPLTPEEPLGAFIGENPNGTWTLTISDDLAGDGGNLNSWSLAIGTATCMCEGTPNAGNITPATSTVCAGNPVMLTLNNNSQGQGTSIQWKTSTTSGGPYTNVIGQTGQTYTISPAVTTYVIASVTCSNSGITTNTTEAVVTVGTPIGTATPSAQSKCSGTPITTIVLTSNVVGGTFTWTRNNTATVTGIAANGTGNIAGTLTNTTSAPITVTFTITPNAAGCTGSNFTATVTVNPIPSATAAPISQSVCSGANINTITYTSATPGVTYSWSRNNTATVTGMAATGTGVISGKLINSTGSAVTVTFTITPSSGGCQGLPFTATVIVNSSPLATISASPNPVCIGSTLQLSATGGTSYSWTGPAGFTSSLQNPVINNFQANQAGAYFVTVTTGSGCSSELFVKVNTLFPPVALASFEPNTACIGSNLQLLGSGAGSYLWTGPNGFTSTLKNPVINNVNTVNSGTYTLTVTSPNGCIATSVINITIQPLPVVNATASDYDVCEGESVQLFAAGNAISFKWSGPYGYSSGMQNPVIDNIPFYLSGIFTVTAYSASGCTSTSTVQINVSPRINPVAYATPNPVCEGGTLQLFASGGEFYLWTGPNGFSSTDQNPVINNVTLGAEGNYAVIISNSGGCESAVNSFYVEVDPIIGIAEARANPNPANEGGNVQFTSTGGLAHSWTGPAGFTSNVQNPSIQNLNLNQAGVYTVRVAYNEGCPAEARVFLKIIPKKGGSLVSNNEGNSEGITVLAPEGQAVEAGKVFPNPTNNFLTVDTRFTGPIRYSVYNSMGELLILNKVTTDKMINTEMLSPGIYHIIYTLGGEQLNYSTNFSKVK